MLAPVGCGVRAQDLGLDGAPPSPRRTSTGFAGGNRGGILCEPVWFLQGFVAAASVVAGSRFSLRICSLVTALFSFSLPEVPPQFVHLSKKNRERGGGGGKTPTNTTKPSEFQRWGFSSGSLSRRAGNFNRRK